MSPQATADIDRSGDESPGSEGDGLERGPVLSGPWPSCSSHPNYLFNFDSRPEDDEGWSVNGCS